MTAPQPDPTPPNPPPAPPDPAPIELYDPNTNPHPLRAQDVTALLAKEIG